MKFPHTAVAMNYRMLSFLMGLAVISIAVFYYLTMRDGFPDGYLTDLDQARARLYPPFIILSIASGLHYIYIGLIEGNSRIGKRFIGGTIIYMLLFAITTAIDLYLSMTLDDGIGG